MSKPQRKPRHVCRRHRLMVLRVCSNCGVKGKHFSSGVPYGYICEELAVKDCFYCPGAEAA